MSNRKVENWIDAYMEYTEDTESAKVFHKWTAFSCIAAALRKKIKLRLGRINVYPNLYVILVGPPGCRKSQAIYWGKVIVQEIPEIRTSFDATTPEAFIQDLADAKLDEVLPDGSIFIHSSLSIFSREFEIFLGQKSTNQKMLITLTDMFDAPETPWIYRTKHSPGEPIPSLFLNILAATTPDSLSSMLPMNSIGGGLTSRIIFVYSAKKYKKEPFPELTPAIIALRDALTVDLARISRMVGDYEFTPEAKAYWIKWYNNYEEMDSKRICAEPIFDGWYERKPLYINKLSMCCAAGRSDNLQIEIRDISQATALIEETEVNMHKAFAAVGRSEIAPDTDMVSKIIRAAREISSMELQRRTWKDIDKKKMENVIETLKAGGEIRQEGYSIGSKYIWIGESNNKV